MTTPNNDSPPPSIDPQPGPTVTVVTPTIQNYDLDALFPPGVNAITNSALPDPKALDKVAPPSRQFVLRTPKPGDPLQYAMGRTIIKPALLNADDSGEHLVLDLMWGVGPMQRVANGIVPSIDPPETWDHSIQFPDLGLILISGSQFEHFTGTQDQPASSIMTALKGSYSSYPGIAHSVITMQPGWNLNITGVCDAVMVIDPRVSFSVLTWTRNPALLLADMAIRCGYLVDWDSVADAADYCDELIGDSGAEIERWKISGVIYDRADLRSWISAMRQYAHCFVDKVGNTIYLRPDKPRAPNHTITKDDIVAGSARMKMRGMGNTVKGVRVTFNFQLTTLDAEFGVFDDPGTVSQLRMPYWAGSFPYLGSHAKRHAEEVYNKSQLEIESFEFVTFDKGLERTVGDVGTITYAPFNLQDRDMAIVEVRQEGRGRWRLRYTDYSDDVFPETNYTDLEFNDNPLFNPYQPIDGPEPDLNWSCNDDTSPQPILTLSWTAVTWAYTKDYDVRVYAVGTPEETIYNSEDDGYVLHEIGGLLSIDLSDRPVEFDRTYQADIYVRSIVDALSSTPGSAVVEVTAGILWDDDPIIASDFTASGFNAVASLEFRTQSQDGLGVSVCRYTLAQGHGSIPIWEVYEPFVEGEYGAGEYLVKWDSVSGSGDVLIDGTSGQEGVWFDAHDLFIQLRDTATESPQVEQQRVIDVTVAVDDGAGAPLTCAESTKRVTLVAMKGGQDFTVLDRLIGTGDLAAHTPNEDDVGGGWTVQSGTFTLTGAATGRVASGGEAIATIDAGTANCAIYADVHFDSQDCGLIGRWQDASNYWELWVDGADTADPVLKLDEINASTRTTRANVTMTGMGPVDTSADRMLRLMFDGDDIIGQCFLNPATTHWEVTYTSASFNTETEHGIHSTSADSEWDTFQITVAEIGLIT